MTAGRRGLPREHSLDKLQVLLGGGRQVDRKAATEIRVRTLPHHIVRKHLDAHRGGLSKHVREDGARLVARAEAGGVAAIHQKENGSVHVGLSFVCVQAGELLHVLDCALRDHARLWICLSVREDGGSHHLAIALDYGNPVVERALGRVGVAAVRGQLGQLLVVRANHVLDFHEGASPVLMLEYKVDSRLAERLLGAHLVFGAELLNQLALEADAGELLAKGWVRADRDRRVEAAIRHQLHHVRRLARLAGPALRHEHVGVRHHHAGAGEHGRVSQHLLAVAERHVRYVRRADVLRRSREHLAGDEPAELQQRRGPRHGLVPRTSDRHCASEPRQQTWDRGLGSVACTCRSVSHGKTSGSLGPRRVVRPMMPIISRGAAAGRRHALAFGRARVVWWRRGRDVCAAAPKMPRRTCCREQR
mmetsp:Transcript_20297/g.64817  ORF Transcript_20297/g.64817 Transcript_20297/m.64817 type:complete len:419 (-) Transcript_20297:947-2203(-)